MNYNSLVETLSKRVRRERVFGKALWNNKVPDYAHWSEDNRRRLAGRYTGSADGIAWALGVIRDRKYLDEKERMKSE